MSPALSTIIVNYNAGALLRRCVDSLLDCPLEIEIIVVDNASEDGSLNALSALPSVQIIKNPVNIGFAAACNIGARVASAPFLLFLNPDCLCQLGALTRLLEVMVTDERVGMAGGFLANFNGTEQAGGRRSVPTPWRTFVRAFGLVRFSDRWPRLFLDFNSHKQPLPKQPVEVEAISGACMMVRREAMQKVGEWDEGYFLHCEDLDWCLRFRQQGWKIVFVPSAKIIHDLGRCGRNRPVFVEWHKHKGMVRFYHKFFRHQYPGVLMGLITIGVWLRFGFLAVYFTGRRIGKKMGLGRG